MSNRKNLLHSDASILDISGTKMLHLDEGIYKKFVHGDMQVVFKWYMGEPVMIIAKSYGDKVGSYMIELYDAHEYVLNTGYQSPKAHELCRGACEAMGYYMDKHAVFKVMDLILNYLPDLIRMPPEPKAIEDANRPAAQGDHLTFIVDGQVMLEVEV